MYRCSNAVICENIIGMCMSIFVCSISCCTERHSTAQYEGDLVTLCGRSCNVCRYYVVMFVTNKIIKFSKKTTQYVGDVVMFLPNKIIKNKKLNYLQKKCWSCPKQPMVLLYKFMINNIKYYMSTINNSKY